MTVFYDRMIHSGFIWESILFPLGLAVSVLFVLLNCLGDLKRDQNLNALSHGWAQLISCFPDMSRSLGLAGGWKAMAGPR